MHLAIVIPRRAAAACTIASLAALRMLTMHGEGPVSGDRPPTEKRRKWEGGAQLQINPNESINYCPPVSMLQAAADPRWPVDTVRRKLTAQSYQARATLQTLQPSLRDRQPLDRCQVLQRS